MIGYRGANAYRYIVNGDGQGDHQEYLCSGHRADCNSHSLGEVVQEDAKNEVDRGALEVVSLFLGAELRMDVGNDSIQAVYEERAKNQTVAVWKLAQK